MKRYYITAKFPQALAKDTFQSVAVEAGSWSRAASLGLHDLLRRPGIKGKQHKCIQLTIQPDFVAEEQ